MSHDGSPKKSAGKTALSPLEIAARQLRKGLRTDAPPARRAEKQWHLLLRWAHARNLTLPADFSGPAFSETAEHDVRYDAGSGRWFKYTIPGHCGLNVDWDGAGQPSLRMATPAEYFRRLVLQNRLFADDLKLEGLWRDEAGGGWRIVTSQHHITGRPATRVEILDGMKAYGFRPLGIPGPNGAPAFRRGSVVVWDGHPGNFVWSDDLPVPIDLIITEVAG